MTMRWIDLSCDLGEAATHAERAVETAIWTLISSANIACGGHIGDETSMGEAVKECRARGITLGAHPSYPDPEGFGRRHVDMDLNSLVESIGGQLDSLKQSAEKHGATVERVKPHGALYNEAHTSPEIGRAVATAVKRSLPDASIVCAEGSALQRAAGDVGLAVVREAFIDRRYMPDGSLQPRKVQGSLLLDFDEAASQALRFARERSVIAHDGTVVEIEFDTLCAHSDMEGSVERVRRVRRVLEQAGFGIGAFSIER